MDQEGKKGERGEEKKRTYIIIHITNKRERKRKRKKKKEGTM